MKLTGAEHAAKPVHQQLDETAKLRLQRATKDFEALLTGYMLKSMRTSIPKDDEMFSAGYGGDLMEGMFDAELARVLSRNSSLGLAEMLYKSITGEDLPAASPRTSPSAAPPVLKQPESTPSGDTSPARNATMRPAVSDTLRQNVDNYASHIRDAANLHGVDANLLKAVMAAESAGNPSARSPKDAKGLMQLMDSTAQDMGVRDVWSPRQNILGGAKYLRELMGRFQGDLEKAVAAYNAGPSNVEKHGGIPPFQETRGYVKKVMDYLRFFEEQEGGGE